MVGCILLNFPEEFLDALKIHLDGLLVVFVICGDAQFCSDLL